MKKSEYSISVAQAAEKYRESEYSVAATDFLTPGEVCDVFNETKIPSVPCFFWGGCRGCERRAAVFLPEWYLPDDAPAHKMPLDAERCDYFAEYLTVNPEILAEIPIKALKIKGSGFKNLTHRDFLGGILSLGIDRSVIGDIAVISEAEAVVFVQDRIKDYILSELKKIGRDGVKVEEAAVSPDFIIPRSYEHITAMVASPRLDAVVKVISGKSRETAAEMVRSGLVELSYRQTDNVSAEVKEGDIISVRGYGKYAVGAATGQTKSGRLKIELLKYI